MVNTGLIVIAFVCAGVAGWNVARKQYFKKKWKDLNGNYGKLKQDLTNALGEVGRVKMWSNSLNEAIAHEQSLNKEYKHLTTTGCRNLKTHEWMVSVASQEPIAGISVIGQDTINSDLCFVIKDFHFNPNDPSDREFAIRQAEELIEIIQNF